MATEVIEIDGTLGEGGGQILRTSLALSMVIGRPFRMTNIRAKRSKPGLLRQHHTAVRAATEVSGASVKGGELGSTSLEFVPGTVRAGEYRFAIGTAGSTTLVLQAILPALMLAERPSAVTIEGGTHNMSAPPATFLQKTFLPALRRMGPSAELTLERYGFFPAGGGRIRVEIEPSAALNRITLHNRGEPTTRVANALVASVPSNVATRERKTLQDLLGWDDGECHVVKLKESTGPGNVVSVELGDDDHLEVFTAFGRRGVSAENVAKEVVRDVRAYLSHDVPVGEHLADQLLIPMALAGGGSFRTGSVSDHTTTNAEVIQRFLPVDIRFTKDGDHTNLVEVLA